MSKGKEVTEQQAFELAVRFVDAMEGIAVALAGIREELAHPRRLKEEQDRADAADRRARGM